MYLPNRQRLFHGNFNHSWCIDLKMYREHSLYESMLGHSLEVSGFPWVTEVGQWQIPIKRIHHCNKRPNRGTSLVTTDLFSCTCFLILWSLANDFLPYWSPSSSIKWGHKSPCLHHRLLVRNVSCPMWSAQEVLHIGILSLLPFLWIRGLTI